MNPADEYKRLCALRDAATPGPWTNGADGRYVWTADMNECVNSSGYDGECKSLMDAAFIAAAHDYAKLCDALMAERAELREIIGDACKEWQGYVEIDTAPMGCREYVWRELDRAILAKTENGK